MANKFQRLSYEWLTKPGLIRYYYQMKREPDTSTDVMTLGFITPMANCVLIRVDSLGDDYMQVEVVRNLRAAKFVLMTLDH